MNGSNERQVQKMSTEKRPLFQKINGQKVKVCAHHEVVGDIRVLYDESGKEIRREYMDGRPAPGENGKKRKGVWTPERGQVLYELDEETGEWIEI